MGGGITDEDYKYAHTVWKEFNIESMKDDLKLYNLSDVLLLADIFENFRSICMNHYGFDTAWYLNAPGIAWEPTLKITKIHLKLLSDPDMFFIIDSGIRGGIATISHRHAKANGYTGTEFELAEKSKFISYLDANYLMVGQCRNNFQHLDLSEWPMMKLMIENICVVSLKLI